MILQRKSARNLGLGEFCRDSSVKKEDFFNYTTPKFDFIGEFTNILLNFAPSEHKF